jgi:hypothetical protein
VGSRYLPGEFQQRQHARIGGDEFTGVDLRRFIVIFARQRRFDYRNQLSVGKRFDDEIISAGLNRVDGFRHGGKPADHDKAQLRKAFQQFESSHTRHAHVANHQVGFIASEMAFRGFAVGKKRHLITGTLQHCAQRRTHGRVVIGDNNSS